MTEMIFQLVVAVGAVKVSRQGNTKFYVFSAHYRNVSKHFSNCGITAAANPIYLLFMLFWFSR